MGAFFAKVVRNGCRDCGRNVELFEGKCRRCACAAKTMPHPVTCKRYCHCMPMFGEFLCLSCETWWSSRVSWACYYQVCKRCHDLVYCYYWRDLTTTEMKREAKSSTPDHRREDCQKCLEIGYYCGDYAKICRKYRY